ncbi:Membrane-bound lytic murein transglycosylase D precursor [Enhygromyxa salina]|uniref:Membrane-bound lytic murein transglycosylase D n=1 Tax=Enhygromyxa salina TaxID=215803 RepID=A0A2S9XBX4_9BACT|nr:LysM peptidoglycan-binding domain-containing protein [Enhygromyxa salina]PRP90355.1 Membrane-bound lytic murein transglycosylase D precursor [Enhygromyxa salina]
MDPLTPSDSQGRASRFVSDHRGGDSTEAAATRREGKRSRPRRPRAHGAGVLAIGLWLSLTSTLAHAGPDAKPDAKPDAEVRVAPPGMEQIGPSWDPDRAVWADSRARMRVRGDRPEGASIHVAYASPDRRWDEDLRRELTAFEDTAFPEGAAPRQTIVDKPPSAWMEKLTLPDLPVRWNRQTVDYLHYFKDDPKGQRLIAAWLNRMGRYEQRLRAIFAEVGVPEDLVYVAMIESGFDPSAKSSVGAAGMWQFMEPTGRVYGLDVEYWVDDRLDFERSGYAAATYLADLKTRFGTWELALAAYNAGYGLVVQSIRTNNTNNFWALAEIENALPQQTRNYVSKIIAAAIVGHNREVFKVSGTPEPRLDLIEVKIPAGTRIEDLAKALDVDEDLLAEVNAAYLRARVPPEGGPSVVRIPRAKHAAFEQLDGELEPPPDQRWATYTVKLGDDLDSIAARYGLTTKQLRRLNAVHDSGEVRGGVTLVVPADGAPDPSAKQLPPLVAVPPLSVPSGSRLVFFRVTRASSSTAIASSFGVAWQQIVSWNDLDPDARLVDGQMLQILVPEGFSAAAAGVEIVELGAARYVIRGTAAHLDAVLAERELVRRGYKVDKGDSLKKIAKKFDLSLGSLARINGVPRNKSLDKGEVILVYVAKGKTRGTVTAPDPRPTTLTAEIEVATRLDGGPSSTDSKPGAREASTPERSRVPGKRYDNE